MPTTLKTPPATAKPKRPESASWLQRIACVSTSRADAGIFQPLLRALSANDQWTISCLVGGTHHDESFGCTGTAFERLSNVELFDVKHFAQGDSPTQVARSTGQAVTEFSRALAASQCDLVFVLGDRPEMLAVALAATIHRIPIAHLHGGDSTHGAIDDACRHAITKLAHLHFPALSEHAERILHMGEEPWRIHTVGALALDDLARFKPSPVDAVSREIGLDLSQPTLVLAYHPETLCDLPPDRQINQVLGGLHAWKGNVLVLGPNADVGHDAVNSALQDFASLRPDTVLKASLSQELFWNCLYNATALVGNSSAGIIESSSFRIPVVNIGDRQQGRIHADNVLHAAIERDEIADILAAALDPMFRESFPRLKNPYGDGHAAERILVAMKTIPSKNELIIKNN
ncbi:MAG: UDP-N-acetylglucosamine 2-epimerase [Planctomycetota bacterium]